MMMSPETYAEDLLNKSDEEIMEEKDNWLNCLTIKREKDHPFSSSYVRDIRHEYLLYVLKELEKRHLQEIAIAKDFVQIGINEYIPFEPKYESIEMKNRATIRAAVKQLRPDKNKILVAQFGNFCGKKWFYDLENILFYNIGTSYFKEACKYGIAFSETGDASGYNKSFLYRYKMSNIDDFEVSNRIVVEWKDIPFEKISTSLKPVDYWKKFKENWGKVCLVEKKRVYGDFGMRLHIELPKRKEVNIAAAMKPMLDGIICAFHPADRDFSSFCEKLCCNNELLVGDEKCVLAAREYIYDYRNGIKWNPEDDKCKFVLITISQSDSKVALMNGNIFEL